MHGVRQNSIRNSNTKNKADTLPPHGFGTSDSDTNPVDFGQLISVNSSATDGTGSDVPVRTELYPDNSIVFIKTPDYCRLSVVVSIDLTYSIYCNNKHINCKLFVDIMMPMMFSW